MVEEGKKDESSQKIFLDKFYMLISTAFGLVAAYAWDKFITTVFEEFLGDSSRIIPTFIYALSVTVIAVFIVFLTYKTVTKLKPDTVDDDHNKNDSK